MRKQGGGCDERETHAPRQADGSFELKTGSTDNQILSIEKAGYAIKEMTINITAKVPVDVGTLEMINA